MISFIKTFLSFLSVAMRLIEKYKTNQKVKSDNDQRNKAIAYENLQKAIQAKINARNANSNNDVMSNDGFKRQ